MSVSAQGVADRRPVWTSLSPAQQLALAPLKGDWATIDATRKQKWLEIAAKFPTMPASERERVQARMSEWARLTPAERAGARLQFQEAKQLPSEQRQARWEAYQALTPDERTSLAQRANPPTKSSSAAEAASMARRAAPGASASSAKSNLVPATSVGTARVVAPTVVQAKPGATTTSITTRSTPPPHQQPGLPKITATAGFVDPSTLLPRLGPQGAAVRAASSSETSAQP
jgi:hypothetical protein